MGFFPGNTLGSLSKAAHKHIGFCSPRLDAAHPITSILSSLCWKFLQTDIRTNETLTYHKALKEEDRMDFIKAVEKEMEDHESRNHWSNAKRSTLPHNSKPTKAIWSFERKRRPDGTILKHKARLFAHGGV
mmetsp:Transcript_1517/g.3873  ORF Transcript_1517/g.3873 Transcript_1517/m.3873 type:complete len:131 (+) Transcript_1517:1345-1737(+)